MELSIVHIQQRPCDLRMVKSTFIDLPVQGAI